MKTFKKGFSIFIFAMILALLQVNLASSKEITKTFKNVTDLRIKTVSGDCSVQNSPNDEVRVTVSYTYDERDFDAEFQQNGGKLYVSENFYGRNNSGRSLWKIELPAGVDVDFSSASGGLELADVTGDVDGETASGNLLISNVTGDGKFSAASGDIEATNISGDVKVSTASGNIVLSGVRNETKASAASGDIRIQDAEGEFFLSAASGSIRISSATGEFDVSTASGDITCEDVSIERRSEFKAASGDVEVELSKSPKGDLEISAASGDCELNYSNNKITGFISMTARNRSGYVKAPFEFDNERVFEKERREFVEKTVKKGAGPKIKLNSASGRVTLAQK